jgi:hypothetical protein
LKNASGCKNICNLASRKRNNLPFNGFNYNPIFPKYSTLPPTPTHPTRPHHPLKKIKNFFHTLKKKIQKKFKLFLIQQKKLWCPATLFDYTLDIAIFCV